MVPPVGAVQRDGSAFRVRQGAAVRRPGGQGGVWNHSDDRTGGGVEHDHAGSGVGARAIVFHRCEPGSVLRQCSCRKRIDRATFLDTPAGAGSGADWGGQHGLGRQRVAGCGRGNGCHEDLRCSLARQTGEDDSMPGGAQATGREGDTGRHRERLAVLVGGACSHAEPVCDPGLKRPPGQHKKACAVLAVALNPGPRDLRTEGDGVSRRCERHRGGERHGEWEVSGHPGRALSRRDRADLGRRCRRDIPAMVHGIHGALRIREPPRQGEGVARVGIQDRVLVLEREPRITAEPGNATRRRRPGSECGRQVAVADLRRDAEPALDGLAHHRAVELDDDRGVRRDSNRSAARIESDDLRGARETTAEGATSEGEQHQTARACKKAARHRPTAGISTAC